MAESLIDSPVYVHRVPNMSNQYNMLLGFVCLERERVRFIFAHNICSILNGNDGG